MRTPTLLRLAGLLLALGLVAGVAPASTADRAPARLSPVRIRMIDMSFSPAWVGIARGRTVVWVNRDTVAHDVVVTSGPRLFHSPLLLPGQTFSHTFRVAGKYRYKCSIHPLTMRGVVRVRS
jgi:plastocyanin